MQINSAKLLHVGLLRVKVSSHLDFTPPCRKTRRGGRLDDYHWRLAGSVGSLGDRPQFLTVTVPRYAILTFLAAVQHASPQADPISEVL